MGKQSTLNARSATIQSESKTDCEETASPIDYGDCANALLRMWMEKVLTDSEYDRIMDKLNKAHEDGRL